MERPLRFEDVAIRAAVRGTQRVLRTLGMIRKRKRVSAAPPPDPMLCRRSAWVRASRSGFCTIDVGLGAAVSRGDAVATITEPLGDKVRRIKARTDGIVIGALQTALVHQGDALVHIAEGE